MIVQNKKYPLFINHKGSLYTLDKTVQNGMAMTYGIYRDSRFTNLFCVVGSLNSVLVKDREIDDCLNFVYG
jgi:hypothetical protein